MSGKCLTDMKKGETAVVKGVAGEVGTARRLESMGIRPGKKITKLGAHLWRGPITVSVDKTKLAIGYAMAKKVIIEE